MATSMRVLFAILALCLLIFAIVFNQTWTANLDPSQEEALRVRSAVRSWRTRSGPEDALSQAGVSKAPAPTMNIDRLAAGEALKHVDARGEVYRFRISPNTTVNMYHSVAGSRRSGDLHNCTQYNIILQGRARLTTKDLVTGVETTQIYGENDYIITPPRTPHLYEFIEDNALLEWWDCPFEAWYYKPYRDRIATR